MTRYQLAQPDDKTAIFENWCDFLNYFDASVSVQLSFINQGTVRGEAEKAIHSPMLTISVIHSETADILSVEDNGIGVKKYNLPYIFQKGFTGDSTDSRKKATGMGLYLVKKMADDLNLHLEAASQWGKSFKIVIFFPKLRSNGGK